MSSAFYNSFWLFLGVVSGAFIQFVFHWIIQWRQQTNAKKLLRVETAINRGELEKLRQSLVRKKERFAAAQAEETDFFLDMSGFNYRIVDPLINTGYFHSLLGADGVARYFRFVNELNTANARNLTEMLREEARANRSLKLLDWLLDTKMPEWRSHLDVVEAKIGGQANIGSATPS